MLTASPSDRAAPRCAIVEGNASVSNPVEGAQLDSTIDDITVGISDNCAVVEVVSTFTLVTALVRRIHVLASSIHLIVQVTCAQFIEFSLI
jgi:hypothetical protein